MKASELVRKSLDLLTIGEKWRLVILLIAILVVGILQMLGVGSIVPLLGMLADPGSSQSESVTEYVRGFYDFSSTDSIVIFLAATAFGVIVVSNLLSAATFWFMFRLVWSIQSRLSTDLLARYMSHPYEVLLGKNPAEAEKNILVEVHIFTNGVVLPVLKLSAAGVVVILVAGFLVIFNPVLALIATSVLGLGYFASFLIVRRKLALAGERRVVANGDRFRAVNEAIAGAKEIQILGRTQEFVARYQAPANRYARTTSLQQILADMPRYAIEILAFGSVMLAALYVAVSTGDLKTVAPVLGVYVVAGYRLMPAMQKVYNAWSQIRFNRAVVDDIYAAHVVGDSTDQLRKQPADALEKLNESINIVDLDYHYPTTPEIVIDSLSLEIKKGQTVSLIGETGSGKTTIAELLIGVLKPVSGTVEIDGKSLNDSNIRSWQDQIGYVPQEIYLIDDSISSNIALGVPISEIDFDAVQRAATIANIDSFVQNELPEKYETIVGDRGVRLSGGQRQRIGIARALYHNPSVLVFDEATSNLDQETEASLHEALERVMDDMTVIIVAHRLNTTQSSDMIYVLDEGRIVGSGKYSDIVSSEGTLREPYSRN